MRVLLIGDVVGKPGRQILCRALKLVIEREKLDFVIANGENSAGGSGITPEIYQEMLEAGVDIVTLGDHIYRRSEITPVLRNEKRIVKPANFPAEAPGHDFAIGKARNGVQVAVISLLGRVFMKPVDCPFKAADRVLAALPKDVRVIVLDFHAEATSRNILLSRNRQETGEFRHSICRPSDVIMSRNNPPRNVRCQQKDMPCQRVRSQSSPAAAGG